MEPIQKFALSVRSLLHRISEKAGWLAPLVARVTLGWVFVGTGWGKLHNLDRVTEFFTQLGIPAPALQAPFVATTEFVCGLLVLVGLFTRVAAVPLMGTMVVALITAKRAEIGGVGDLFGLSEYLYFVLLVGLFFQGPGRASLDCWLVSRFAAKSRK